MKKLLLLTVFTGFVGYGSYHAGMQGLSRRGAFEFVRNQAMELMGHAPPPMIENALAIKPMANPPIVYYRHPDGEPSYSSTATNTADGRPFLPVHSNEDVSFDVVEKPEQVAAETGRGEKRILYYRNPMGLPDTSPAPKKDSMGMDYLPVYDGENDDGSVVRVSGGKLQRTGVKTELATRSVITRAVSVPGVVELDERRISVLSIRTEAFLENIYDITTGSMIKKGQPLFSFYAKEMVAAAALYLSDIRTEGKKDELGSLQRLQNLGASRETIEEIERTGKVPVSMVQRSPRDGLVLERMAVEGMMAKAGETLFKIADTSVVWVMADVPEYDLDAIRTGAIANVRVRGLVDQSFSGKVDVIYPEIQGQTRTAKIRIQIDNPDGQLLANMYADVRIASGHPEPVVTVPESAVIDSGDRQVVILDQGEGRFEPRAVTLGARGNGMIEIADGVSEGDRVVVSANFLIDAESNLKAALSALVPTEASK